MTEIKAVIISIIFTGVVCAIGFILPPALKKQNYMTPGSADILQGIILAYGIIFGALMPITSYISTHLM